MADFHNGIVPNERFHETLTRTNDVVKTLIWGSLTAVNLLNKPPKRPYKPRLLIRLVQLFRTALCGDTG